MSTAAQANGDGAPPEEGARGSSSAAAAAVIVKAGGHGALDGGHTVCENKCINTCWVVILGGSSSCTQQSRVMRVMTRTAASGLVLEFVAMCFVLCSGWI